MLPDPRPCQHCGTVFQPGRSDARTCSTRCRVALHRDARRDAAAEETRAPKPVALAGAAGSVTQPDGRTARRRAALADELPSWLSTGGVWHMAGDRDAYCGRKLRGNVQLVRAQRAPGRVCAACTRLWQQRNPGERPA